MVVAALGLECEATVTVYLLHAEQSGQTQCLVNCSVKIPVNVTNSCEQLQHWPTTACTPVTHSPAKALSWRKEVSPSTVAFLQLPPSPGPLWPLNIPNGIHTLSQKQGWTQEKVRGRGQRCFSCFSWIQNFTICKWVLILHTHNIRRKGRRGWGEYMTLNEDSMWSRCLNKNVYNAAPLHSDIS